MPQLLIGIAALIHLYIFVMESLLWGKPRINKAFGMSAELAEQNRLFAFNQGFYNLFLAIAAVLGIVYPSTTLMAYAAASMLGASLVLLYSKKSLIRPALIQGLPPLLGLIFLGLKLLS